MLNKELEWMYALERFGIKPGLEVMEQILDVLGHPEASWPSIHVAGTNGKGSTCSFMASALQEAGYSVGLYTSPHIHQFNERIRINGVSILDEDLVALMHELKALLEKNSIEATFFEFTTALAFMYFAQKKVDIAVVEVGLGGRLDSTNVITPLVSVITNIGLDHTEILGSDKISIAKEKAGTIKPRVPVVTAEKDPEVILLFQDICRKNNTDLHQVHEEYSVVEKEESLEFQSFSVSGGATLDLTIPLLGKHQIDNVLAAFRALKSVGEKGFSVSDEQLQKSFATTTWEGRMEVVSREPLIIVDGAHNNDGIWMLYNFIRTFKSHDVLILSMKQGKDLHLLFDRIVPLFTHVIVTEGSYDPRSAQDIVEFIQKRGYVAEAIPSNTQAVRRAKELLPDNGFLLVTGSLYMIGDVLKELKK